MKKSKVKGHKRVKNGKPEMVSPHERVSVSFNSEKGKMRPSVYGINSPEQAREACKIIKAFKEAEGESYDEGEEKE